jgi:hypothetical protein
MADTEPVQDPKTEDMSGCLVRLLWLVAGPLGLLIIAAVISRGPDARVALSAGYWLLVLLMVAARYVDIVKFQGTNLNGEPTSKKDWKKYSLQLVTLSVALWLGVVALS